MEQRGKPKVVNYTSHADRSVGILLFESYKMMKISTYLSERRVRLSHQWARVFLSLSIGLMLPGATYAQNSPTGNELQILQTLNQLLGEEQAELYQKIIPADQAISWQVYLPSNDLSEKPGVFVYVSPRKTGQIDSRWRSVMDQQNLIYIAADDSGNRIGVSRRMVLATMAIRALAQQYSFAQDRIIVSGFSGGGRIASKLATQYPEVFTGAIYICGADFWKKDQTPKLERLLQNKYVFVTGSRDFNLDETRRVHRRYINAGAAQSMLLIIPGMAHAHPDGNALTEALEYLN